MIKHLIMNMQLLTALRLFFIAQKKVSSSIQRPNRKSHLNFDFIFSILSRKTLKNIVLWEYNLKDKLVHCIPKIRN